MIKQTLQQLIQQIITPEREDKIQVITREIKKRINQAETIVNALTLRERVLVLLGSAGVLYFLWNLLLGSVFPGQDQMNQKVQISKQQVMALHSQLKVLNQQLQYNPNLDLSQKTAELRKKNIAARKQIVEQVQKMTSPKEMVSVVKNIVNQATGMTLVLLESSESKPLFQPQGGADKVSLQVYRHGLTLVMEGEYFETLKFLQTLENQQQKVLWREISYQVEEYPKARIKILIETLGLEEGWIGV